jgi:hypothetical protein
LVFWVQFGVNQIGNLQPGQGYQVNFFSACVLVYPCWGKILLSCEPLINHLPLYLWLQTQNSEPGNGSFAEFMKTGAIQAEI